MNSKQIQKEEKICRELISTFPNKTIDELCELIRHVDMRYYR